MAKKMQQDLRELEKELTAEFKGWTTIKPISIHTAHDCDWCAGCEYKKCDKCVSAVQDIGVCDYIPLPSHDEYPLFVTMLRIELCCVKNFQTVQPIYINPYTFDGTFENRIEKEEIEQVLRQYLKNEETGTE